MKGPAPENDFAKSAGEMSIPSQYTNKDYGKKVKAVAKKVVVKSSGPDGQVYGIRAIMTKESSFIDYLVTEANDLSSLPDIALSEIKNNIRAGAKDLTQQWKNALELVHKAYQVANMRRPTPDQKGAWKQYEDMIKYGVQQLTATRGLDGEWRMTNVLVREAADGGRLAKRRFFAEVPGSAATEVEGDSLDDIIDKFVNKFRRHGTKVRVDERNKLGAVLSIWKGDQQVEKMVIKELS